jgi:hypothetical protein
MSKRPAHTRPRLHPTMSDRQYVLSPEGRAAVAAAAAEMMANLKAELDAIKAKHTPAAKPKRKAKPKAA